MKIANLGAHISERTKSLTKTGLALLAAGSMGMLSSTNAHAQVPANNPDWVPMCEGLDVGLVLDTSGSIDGAEFAQLTDSLELFLDVYSDDTNRIAVSTFDTLGSLEQGYTPMTPANNQNLLDQLAAQGTGGCTNYESGFRTLLHHLDGNANTTHQQNGIAGTVNAEYPDILIFFTDGQPNTGMANGAPNNNGTGLNGGECGLGAQAAANAVIDEANVFKNNGSHILSVVLDPDGNNFIDFVEEEITGPNATEWDGSAMDFGSGDYQSPPDFSMVFNQIADICTSDLEVEKAVTDTTPAAGDTITYTVTLTNQGPAPATNVTLEDIQGGSLGIPFNINGPADAQLTQNGNDLEWFIPSINAARTLTFTYSVVVGYPTGADNEYRNLAQVVDVVEGDNDSNPGNGVDTNNNNVVADDPGDEDDGDGVDLTVLPASIALEKVVSAVNPGPNGADTLAVTFILQVINDSDIELTNLTLTDDLDALLGDGFVGILAAPSLNQAPTEAYSNVNLNGGFNGDTQINLLAAGTQLQAGDSFRIEYTAEIDPDLALDTNQDNQPGPMVNVANVEGEVDPDGDGNGDGPTVMDTSDDQFDGDNNDGETPIPGITLEKSLVDVAFPSTTTGGAPENLDAVFEFVVTNVGATPLTNVRFQDDLFGTVTGVPTKVLDVVSINEVVALNQPAGFNFNLDTVGTGWIDQGVGNPNSNGSQALALGAGALPAGESVAFRVEVTMDLDLDSPNPLLNSAFVQGDALVQPGVVVTVNDQSDDQGDVNTDGPDDGDDPGDDPTPIPAIAITKTLTSGATPSGFAPNQYIATFDYVIENVGSLTLEDIAFFDEFELQNPEVVSVDNGSTILDVAADPGNTGAWNADFINSTTALIDPPFFAPFEATVGQTNAVLDPGDRVTLSAILLFTVTDGAQNASPPPMLENTALVRGNVVDSGLVIIDESNDGLFTGDDPTDVPLMPVEIFLGKGITNIQPNAADDSLLDMTFRLTVENPRTLGLAQVTLTEDFADHFGPAFIDFISAEVTDAALTGNQPNGVTVPNIGADIFNPDYDGGETDADLITEAQNVYLAPFNNFTVEVIVTIDPDRAVDTNQDNIPGPLFNQAETSGNGDSDGDGTGDGIIVTAVSDNGYQPTDPDDPNDPEDPTPVPGIRLDKDLVDIDFPAANGVPENADLRFRYTITNVGGADLSDVTFEDDIFGDAAGVPTKVLDVTNVGAINIIAQPGGYGFNLPGTGWVDQGIGNPGNNQHQAVSVSGAVLESGEQVIFEVTLTVDLTLDGGAPIENTAFVSGDAQIEGQVVTVTDQSDDNGDIDTDGPDDGDDPTDDPTPIPAIAMTKTLVEGAIPAGGQPQRYRATYSYTIRNVGDLPLVDVSFADTFLTQNAGVVSIDDATLLNIAATTGQWTANQIDALAAFDPANQTPFTGGNATLPTGEQVSFQIEVEFTVTPQAEADEETLENTGIARGLVDEDGDGDGDGQQVEDESNDGLFTGDDPTDTPLQPAEIFLGKSLADVSPNAQTEGHYDLTFTLVVENPAALGIADIELTDDFAAQFGDAFIGLTSAAVTNPVDLNGNYPGGVVQPVLGTGILNPNYDGETDTRLIREADGVYLASNDFFTVTVVVVVDPDQALDVDQDDIPGPLFNQARVTGDADSDEDGTGDGIPVEALSDDGYTPGGPDDPEDPEDPTPIPGVRLDKELVTATQPAEINGVPVEDTIELVLEYTIYNTGGTDLTDMSFIENLADTAAQVTDVISEDVDPLSFFTNSLVWTADDIEPGFATTNAGGPSFGDFTGGIATLEPGGFVAFQVTLVAELDLSLQGDFLNQAEVAGLYDLDGDGNNDGDIRDESDDVVDIAEDPSETDGPDAGDDPTDDPTPLPLIVTDKDALGGVVVLDAFNNVYRQTWRYTITNAGNIDLLTVAFEDDFAGQNAEIISVDAVEIQNIDLTGLTPGSPWTVAANPATFLDADFAVTPTIMQEFGNGVGNTLAPGDVVIFEAVMDFTTQPLEESVILENVSTVFAEGDANGDGVPDDINFDNLPDLLVEDDSTGTGGTGDDPTTTELDPPAIQLEKDLVASSTEGATELTLLRLRFEVENPGKVPLADLSLFDNMAAQFGDDGNGNFVFQGVVPNTLQVVTPPAADGYSTLVVDPTYDGDQQDNMLLPTSQLAPGASGVLQVTVRVNTDVSYLADPFENIAEVEGFVDQDQDGAADDNDNDGNIDPPISDFSDDDFDNDAVDEDNDGDNGNDPTPLPAIQLIKEIASVTYPHDTDGDTSNNEMRLVFDFTIRNTGDVPLYNVALSDNLLAEPMVTEIVSAQVLNVDSFNAPLWTADTLDVTFVDPGELTPFTTGNGVDLGVADLEPGDEVIVTIEIEARINPELNTSFGNTADVQAIVDIDENGTPTNDTSTVSDDSDGDGNIDEDDPEDPGDDPGDDPVKLPLIATTKAITGNGVMNLGQNQFRVTFEHEIFNIGSVDLVDLGFLDDFGGQNPEIESIDLVEVGPLTYTPADQADAPFTATTLPTAFMDGDPAVETLFTGGVATLAPGDRLSFDVTVTFTMQQGFVDFDLGNIATASGFGDQDGDGEADDTDNDGTPDTKVSDDSGATIDENGETEVPLPVLQVEKDLVGVAPSGRVDGDTTLLTFLIQLNNLGTNALADLTLTEDLEGLFGGLYEAGGFVGLVGIPVQLDNPTDPYTNIDFDPAFDGTTANSNMLLPTSQLAGEASTLIQFTVEIDHDNGNLPDPLVNTAIGTGTPDLDEDGTGDPDQTEVTDTSDDDFDNDADDDNGDQDPTNDPTPLPAINSAKGISVPFASVGETGQGNLFAGQFTFAIANTGEVPLYNLTFRDDFLDDANVVSVVTAVASPVVSSLGGSDFNGALIDESFIVDQLDQPFLNGANAPVLAVDEVITFAVNIVFEVADIELTEDLLNSAEVIALVDTNGSGDPGDDGGDSIADTTDANGLINEDDPDDPGDDRGDDPTEVPVARIGIAKSFVIDPITQLPGEVYEPDPAFFVYEVELTVQNTGDFPLADIELVDEDPATWGTTVVVEEQPFITVPPSLGSVFTLANDYNPAGGNFVLSNGPSILLPGEFLTLRFKFRIDITDPDLEQPLNENYTNQAEVIGFVDLNADGTPELFDFDGDGQPDGPISAQDQSDSGFDPFGTNPDAPGDMGTPDDPTPLPNPLPPEFFVQKSANPDRVAKGDVVAWTISVLNTGLTPGIDVDLVDVLPPGFAYLRGSAFVDGVPLEPTIGLPGSYPRPGGDQVLGLDGTELYGEGEVLIWRVDRIDPGEEVQIVIQTQASIAVDPGQVFINRAYVYDEKWPEEDRIRSNIAEARVTIIAEPVFDCGTVIGQVFNDRNRDGYQDAGEDGIPAARLVALANGTALEIITDEYGRYHIPCAAIPNADRGSNFILKLDPRTLPSGFRMTSENPRVIRLTPGKTSKANFGAGIDRVVRLDINRCAYIDNSFRLKREYGTGLNALVEEAVKGPGTVRLSYRAYGNEEELAEQRMNRLKVWLSQKLSERAGRSHGVSVEIEVVKVVGQNALPSDIACLPIGKAFVPRNVVNAPTPEGRDVTKTAGFIVPPGYRLFVDAEGKPFFVVDPTSPGNQPRVRGTEIGEGATVLTDPEAEGFLPLGNIPIYRNSSGELRVPYGQ